MQQAYSAAEAVAASEGVEDRAALTRVSWQSVKTGRRLMLPVVRRNGDSGRLARSSWQVKLMCAMDGEDANKRLWAAVLNDAVVALSGQHPSSRSAAFGAGSTPRALWKEACVWVLSREAGRLGTFESVCAVLELESETVRRDLCVFAADRALRYGVGGGVEALISLATP